MNENVHCTAALFEEIFPFSLSALALMWTKTLAILTVTVTSGV